MKKYLLITSLSIFTLYIIVVMLVYGVLPSISDSYYHLNNKIFFSLTLIGFSFPIIITQNNIPFYFAGSSIMFVAVAPDFHVSTEGDVHFFCAILGIISGITGLLLKRQYFPVIFFVIVGIILYFVPNHIFWIEILTFYTIILTLIFNKNSYE